MSRLPLVLSLPSSRLSRETALQPRQLSFSSLAARMVCKVSGIRQLINQTMSKGQLQFLATHLYKTMFDDWVFLYLITLIDYRFLTAIGMKVSILSTREWNKPILTLLCQPIQRDMLAPP